jgi:hypothetical protein
MWLKYKKNKRPCPGHITLSNRNCKLKGIAMVTARNAVREAGARYKRHQPELTLLYQIVETYYHKVLRWRHLYIRCFDGQQI